MQYVHLIFTYVISTLVAVSVVKKLFLMEDRYFLRLLVVFIGLGPLLVSWFLYWLLTLAPGLGDGVYISIMYCLFLCGLLFARREFVFVSGRVGASLRSLLSLANGRLIFLAVVGAYFSNVLVHALGPLVENDMLKYVVAASEIHARHSFLIYPFVKPIGTGMYVPGAHPPAYLSSLVWGLMISSHGSMLPVKVIALFYSCAIVLALWGACYPVSRMGAFVAAVLLMATPVFYTQSSSHSIDMIRVYPLLVTVFFVMITRPKSVRMAALAGGCAGLALFSHTLGILVFPFACTVVFLCADADVSRRLQLAVCVSCVAFVVGGWQFIYNCMTIGVPFVTRSPLIGLLPLLDMQEHYHLAKGLAGVGGYLRNGYLSGWLKPFVFGFTYWMLFLGFISFKLEPVARFWVFVMSAIVVEFLAFMVVVAVTGDALNFAHYRYYLTVQPFVCGVGGVSLVAVFNKVFRDAA